MSNFWKKRINMKNINKISNELGIEKEKVKELIDGEREIEGETLDKVLNIVNEDKISGLIKKQDIWKWYLETDLKELRRKFGYEIARNLAKELKIDDSTLSLIENHSHRISKVTPVLEKVYYFYNNDFNRKIDIKKTTDDNNKLEHNELYKNYNGRERKKIVKKDAEKIWKWYLETDFYELLKQSQFDNQNELRKKLNISQASMSRLFRHQFNTCNGTIKLVYDLFNNENQKEIIEEPTEEIIIEETPVEIYLKKAMLKNILQFLTLKKK